MLFFSHRYITPIKNIIPTNVKWTFENFNDLDKNKYNRVDLESGRE